MGARPPAPFAAAAARLVAADVSRATRARSDIWQVFCVETTSPEVVCLAC
jgi:hypothetical protein